MLDPVGIMPFDRFCYIKKQIYCEDTIFIEGCFKEEGSNEIHKGDNFEAHKVAGLSVDEIYSLYCDWFNYTLRPGEKKRFAVSAKLKDVEQKGDEQ